MVIYDAFSCIIEEFGVLGTINGQINPISVHRLQMPAMNWNKVNDTQFKCVSHSKEI